MLSEGDRVCLGPQWWLYRDKPAVIRVIFGDYVAMEWPDGTRSVLKRAAIEFAVTCDHVGCLESVDVARDCWLSRTPPGAGVEIGLR